VKRPSRNVINEWIDEWADGGNDSGWSPYKSVAVSWDGEKRECYYYKLADNGQYDVKPAPECGDDYVCSGGSTKFWKVAKMWDKLLEKKKRDMEAAIGRIKGITFHQQRVLRKSLQENYDAALEEKATFCRLRNAIHGEFEQEVPKKRAATFHKKPAATIRKKPAATIRKKPAATVNKKPAAKILTKPAAIIHKTTAPGRSRYK
jgi:hypothetical protein